MDKILVTGAGGLLGRYVVDALVDAGMSVSAADKTFSRTPTNANIIEGDLLDYKFVRNIVRGHQAVVHLAAISHPDQAPPIEIYETNIRLAHILALATLANDVQRVVLAASQSVLGLPFAKEVVTPEYVPVDESYPCNPKDSYSLSKLASEYIFEDICEYSDLSVTALRYPRIWDPKNFQEHVNDRLSKKDQSAKSLWAYIDARDAATAVLKALDNRMNTGYEVFNIAADEVFSEWPTSELLSSFPSPPVIRSPLIGKCALFSSEKAAKKLGFRAIFRWTPSEIIEDRDGRA